MSYYSQDEVRKAKTIDLLTYLRNNEPGELVHLCGENYCTRTHDSLKISNGKWHWFSRGIGGRSALDYLIKVREMPFIEAVGLLLGQGAVQQYISPVQQAASTQIRLLLPELEDRPVNVYRYLIGRGIAPEVIYYCISHKLLFESKEYHNAVFVGYDRDGVARYAALRGTTGSFKGEVIGSDKHYSFSICLQPAPATLHVFESAIDLLSYATMEKLARRDWKKDALLSLAGVFKQRREKVVPVALSQFLSDHRSVQTICLHLDNDEIGRSAAKGIADGLAESPYQIINCPPKYGKDVNDQLQWERFQSRKHGLAR